MFEQGPPPISTKSSATVVNSSFGVVMYLDRFHEAAAQESEFSQSLDQAVKANKVEGRLLRQLTDERRTSLGNYLNQSIRYREDIVNKSWRSEKIDVMLFSGFSDCYEFCQQSYCSIAGCVSAGIFFKFLTSRKLSSTMSRRARLMHPFSSTFGGNIKYKASSLTNLSFFF